MTLDEYQALASRTSQWQPGHPQYQGREHKIYCAAKIGEEAGEAASPVIKSAFNGHPENVANVREELGDLMWFISEQARAHGLTLEEVAAGNIEKLQRRYPGAYRDEDSIARRDVDEGSPTASMRAIATIEKGSVSTSPEAGE